MFLQQRFWLAIGLLIFAAAHLYGASKLAAASSTQDTAVVLTHTGD